MHRLFLLFVAALALIVPRPVAAQGSFDLVGPELSVTVTRGGERLPIGAVPNLRGGDRLEARALLPADQSARYLLVVAFLRGATNPPPKDWFFRAETWRKKGAGIDLVVPAGAEQAILFLAPEAGGGFDAVRDAVRGRPGVFVRAAQDLFQASLDRARLDAFLVGIARIADAEPERLASAAPVLADSLRIKLNAECLTRQRSQQAACLAQNRDGLVLQAQRGATWTETLTGKPIDLAYGVAATREGGAGYYSPYIGLARDLARLFGAFRSAQYQYLPALAVGGAERVRLQLNAAPSFQNPRSVLVAPLPPIGAAAVPVLRPGSAAATCLARPDLVLPLEDAALVFATGYARDLSLHVTAADGRTAALPVVADAQAGGLRLGGSAAAVPSVASAVLHGRWGFDAFTGPRLPVQLDTAGAWTPQPDGAVVVGRDHPLRLRGGAPACVEGIALGGGSGEPRAVAWKATAPDEITATLPLGAVRPGPLTLAIARYGASAPERVALTARGEASRLDRFTIHAGDRTGTLEGARLDQVARLALGERRFVPGTLVRGSTGDRLELTADDPVRTGGEATATVWLRDGRSAGVAVRVAAPRPAIEVVNRAVAMRPERETLPIALPDGLLPAGAGFTFSVRLAGGAFGTGDALEIATADGGAARLTVASGAVQRVGGDVAVGTFTPAALLGPAVAGPLRVRVWQGEVASDWRTLALVARLPGLRSLDCPAGAGACTLSGRDLFTVAAIGTTPDLAGAVTLPAGFVGDKVAVPRPAGDRLFLRLHDAGDAVVGVEVPAGQEGARETAS